MSGGGASGTVVFADFIQDLHGAMLARTDVFNSQAPSPGSFNAPDDFFNSVTDRAGFHFGNSTTPLTILSAISTMVSAHSGNPYETFVFTDVTTNISEVDTYFDLAAAQVTGYVARSYADFVTSAILGATSVTTSQIEDLAFNLAIDTSTTPAGAASNIFKVHSAGIRSELDDYVSLINTQIGGNLGGIMSSASSSALHSLALTGFTTLWESVVDQANTKLSDCSIPKVPNLLAVLTKAAKDTNANIKAAVRLAQELINGDYLEGVTTQFAARRERAYQAQVSEFAGTMADLNAVNSTAFLWGVALLRSEQAREVADLDAQLTLQAYQQAIQTYAALRAQDLQAGMQAELAGTQAHNQLLDASIKLLALLKQREEITPAQVLSIWGPMFNAEVGAFAEVIRSGLNQLTGVYSTNQNLELDADKVNLEAQRINKASREQRYLNSLAIVSEFFKNQPALQASLANIKQQQETFKIVATREFEGHSLDKDVEAGKWDMYTVWKGAADILAAPAGMAATVPLKPSVGQQLLGQGLQAASTIASAAIMA